MEGYLGEKIVHQKDTEFKEYGCMSWAMYFLKRYHGIDGSFRLVCAVPALK